MFTMYMHCKILNGIDGDEKERILKHSNVETFAYCIIAEPKLILKKLSSINRKDTIKCIEIIYNKESDAMKSFKESVHGDYYQLFEVLQKKHEKHVDSASPFIVYSVYELLRQMGYAIPMFFGPNHWANGMDAFDLNLAVLKKENEN